MGGRWSTPLSGRFTPGKDAVPIVWKAGWAPEPAWTGAENFAPNGIRSPPHRPPRNQSLYRHINWWIQPKQICFCVYDFGTDAVYDNRPQFLFEAVPTHSAVSSNVW